MPRLLPHNPSSAHQRLSRVVLRSFEGKRAASACSRSAVAHSEAVRKPHTDWPHAPRPSVQERRCIAHRFCEPRQDLPHVARRMCHRRGRRVRVRVRRWRRLGARRLCGTTAWLAAAAAALIRTAAAASARFIPPPPVALRGGARGMDCASRPRICRPPCASPRACCAAAQMRGRQRPRRTARRALPR